MINYIRKHKLNEKEFLALEKIPWDDEIYLKPVEHESWLMFDFDELKETVSSNDNESNKILVDKNYLRNLESSVLKLTQEVI